MFYFLRFYIFFQSSFFIFDVLFLVIL